MDGNSNVHKSGGYVYSEKNEQEAPNASFQNKLALMDEKIQQLNDLTVKLSEQVVTKTDLQEVLSTKDAAPTFDTNVEMAVVAESASYAKQLVNLLEQAAMNYAKEKEAKEQLQEHLMQAKRELEQMTKLKQQSDAQLANAMRAKASLNDQLIVKETELQAVKNNHFRTEKQLKEYEGNLSQALTGLKLMSDELNLEKEELMKVKLDNAQLKSEVASLNAIINNPTAIKLKEEVTEEKQLEAEQE